MSTLTLIGGKSGTQPPASVPEQAPLDAFWADLAAAALYVKWRTQNPGEYRRLKDYAAAGGRPTMLTAFGRALVDIVDVHRAAGATAPLIP